MGINARMGEVVSTIGGNEMNNLDVAGVLTTYSIKCSKARNDEHLKDLIRELKKELSAKEIKKMKVIKS